MSYPTKYTRQYDFQSFQNSNPTTPLPGDKVNVDLNAVVTSIGEIVDFVKTVIRSDGDLANNIVTYDKLSPALQSAGLSPLSAWVTGTEYTESEIVVASNAIYKAEEDHTAGTFADDLAAGKWTKLNDLPTVEIGTVTSLAPGATPTVANSGDDTGVTLDFGIPTSVTIAIGTVTTVAAGESATVTNSGTAAAMVLDFEIPQGAAGNASVSGTPTTGNLAKFAGATSVEDSGIAAANVLVDADVGVSVQAYDAELAALAGLTSAADKVPYFTGSGTAALADLTSYIRTLLDDANAAAALATLAARGQGKETIGVASGGIFPATTNGCAALAQAETTTNKINYKYLAFDASAVEYAWVWFPTPKSYNASTFTMRFVWTHPSTATNFAVVWQAEMLAVANDDALDTAVGTAITVTDTGGTTQDFYTSDETSAITPSNTAAKQDWIACRISRLATDGSDTLAVDAHLVGVEIYYQTDAATDA